MDEDNKTLDPEQYEKTLRKAQGHVTALALLLTRWFEPIDAAGIMAGGAVGILTDAFGPDKAKEYLKGLWEQFDADGSWPGQRSVSTN